MLRSFGRGIGRLLAALVGTWSPPGWLRAIGRQLSRLGGWARANRGAATVAGLVAALVLTGGGWTAYWYKHRPKPTGFTVTVNAPGITAAEPGATPDTLTLDFNGSVAPLKLVGKTLNPKHLPTLSPKIDGTWRWSSDSQLSFAVAPGKDWPIGARYTVELPKRDLLKEGALLDEYSLKFTTPLFTAAISESQFYQDPTDASLKKIVATVRFSHPVETASFEKRIHMQLDSRIRTEPSQPWKFHVTYDKYKLNAYLHSEPLVVPESDHTFQIKIDDGLVAARGGPSTKDALSATVNVPGVFSFFRIENVAVTLVDNERFEPEQVLVLSTTTGVAQKELAQNLTAWVLPVNDPTNPKETPKHPHDWSDVTQVGPQALKAAKPLTLESLATEKEYDTTLTFRYHADPGRYIYVLAKKGIRAFGGYVLGEPWQGVVRVGDYPPVLHIMQNGALVSLGGSRKVSLYARDVGAVHFEVGRVLPDQLQHLVSQTSGSFASPDFVNDSNFGADNLVERFESVQELGAIVHGKPQYLGFDLSTYLQNGGNGKRGLFLLRAESWSTETQSSTGERDSRLILVTDLGMVVKDNADGTHDVFVQNLHTGDAVSGANVQVLGKNGLPIYDVATDGNGRARVGTFKDFEHEKSPLLYLVKKGGDSSFLPIGRDRQLDLSRFDVGGIEESGRVGLSAYLFSDRGIYRPGDEIRVGAIVKPRDWSQPLAGIPLHVEVTDPRGLTVRRDIVKLDNNGFFEIRHAPPESAPTGSYTFNVRLIKDGEPANLLGSTSVRVREFLPDRMKITAHLSQERTDGWVSPKDLKGRVTLLNLYGTPASDHKIKATITLTPELPTFGKLRGYEFFDPKQATQSVTDTLADVQTDDDGGAELDLGLEKYATATYRLTFSAQGFEAEGGRSVAAESSVVVSPMEYLVGHKADGDLTYMSRGTRRAVDFIAVGATGAPVAVPSLRQVLVESRYVSVLTKQPNGTYKYQSVHKAVELSSKPLELSAGPTKLNLPTNKPGDFALEVRGASGDVVLSRVTFSVMGDADLSRSLEKNAQLEVALKSADVQPGQEVELSIRGPYAGAGLITVERDHVYTHKWFHATTTASTQTIKIPDDMEGNGYINVAFLRDVNSPEVFMSPLSYGVVPFFISRGKRQIAVELNAADNARPGDSYKIHYKTDRPARVAIWAVDEGILRVADYKTPDPLSFFFQKRALEVRTSQILDLLLPEFERLQAASGGDSDEAALGANLNPFKRKRDKPVAFWSGIIDAGPTEKEWAIPLPDSYNGTLRLFAVAVSPDAIGAADRKALVRGDFVIAPSMPTFATPGDEFEVGVAVSNAVVGSGNKAQVELTVTPSSHLSIVGSPKVTLTIAENHEASTSIRVKVNDQLGSGTLSFVAQMPDKTDKHAKLSQDLSVRPAMPYATLFSAGHLRDSESDVNLTHNFYPDFRTLRAGISTLPLGLAHGLVGYLEKFPHGCTEQITSQTVPVLVLGKHSEFGYDAKTSQDAVEHTIATLRSRQNDEGGFGLWTANPETAKFPTVYALHMLTEAKERGFAVPPDLLKSGLGYLQGLVSRDGDNLDEDRLRAYAVYVMTRNGVLTTPQVAALQKKFEANYPQEWKLDLAGVWLAATLKLLKQDRQANAILDGAWKFGDNHAWSDAYYDGLVHDGGLLYVVARHFPDRAKRLTAADINAIATPIYRGGYNTLSSAFALLGLEAYATLAGEPAGGKLSLAEVLASRQRRPLQLPKGLVPRVDFSGDAVAIHVGAAGGFDSYWMVSEAGFARTLPTQELKQKLEILREFTDDKGKPISKVHVGDEIEVHVKLRTTDKDADYQNIDVVDLLPAGFEVVMQEAVKKSEAESSDENKGDDSHDGDGDGDSSEGGGGGGGGGGGDEPAATAFSLPIALSQSTFSPEYGDVREDRVVLYGNADNTVKEFVYVIKATNVGTFTVPPIFADSMYDRTIMARGLGGRLTVEKK